jgi:hypothetical protein
MGHDDSKHSFEHKRHQSSGEGDRHKSKKRHKSHKDGSSKHKKKRDQGPTRILDEDVADDDMWLEKNIDVDGEYVRTVCMCSFLSNPVSLQPLATDIPTADSLRLTSHVATPADGSSLPEITTAQPALKRDEWMLEPSHTPASSSSIPQKRALALEDQSLTEEYGEPSTNIRSAIGGVDFFSSLGTERQKKPKVQTMEVSSFEL